MGGYSYLSEIPLYPADIDLELPGQWRRGDLIYVEGAGYRYYDGTQWQRLPAPYVAPVTRTALPVQNVTASANINTYKPLPTPLVGTLVIPDEARDWLCLLILSAFIDTTGNNVEVAVDVDATGALTSPAGANPEQRLHVNAKSPVGVALSEHATLVAGPGSTRLEIMTAGGACNLSDITFTIIPLAIAN